MMTMTKAEEKILTNIRYNVILAIYLAIIVMNVVLDYLVITKNSQILLRKMKE